MQAMQQLLARVGGPKVHMKPEVESALTKVAEDLVGQALSFGCSMARRRQAHGAAPEDLVLQPADLAAFLEQTWYDYSFALSIYLVFLWSGVACVLSHVSKVLLNALMHMPGTALVPSQHSGRFTFVPTAESSCSNVISSLFIAPHSWFGTA